jgi:ABC-type transport system involved in multi-copper enzyme maturation permease subunit
MTGYIVRRLHAVLAPAWLTGPIFDKELRVASRRRRQFALRFLYILALTGFVGVVWLGMVQYEGNASFVQSRMAAAGQRIVTTIVFFQFFAMQVLAIVLLSSAISDEVYHRTLGILMTTPINGLQIVMGKLLSRLLQLVLLLAISLPMLAIVRVLGGVSWDYLLSGLCITLTAAIFAGSLSLLFSIRNRHAYGVIIRTMFTLVCLYFVLPALLGFAVAYFFSRAGINLGSRAGAITVLGPIVVSLNPISSMAAITEQMFSPRGPAMFSLPMHCGFMLSLSALVLGRAMDIVRKVALRQAVGQSLEDRRRKTEKRRRRTADSGQSTEPICPPSSVLRPPAVRRVVGPPVVWKELRAPFIQGIDSRNSYIGLAVAIVALVFTYLSAAQAKSLNEDFTHITYVMLFVFIGGLINIVFSATRITTEKESQAWPLLLATPLSDWDILLGKAVSAFRRCLPIWGLLAGHVLLFTLAGYIHPIATFHLLALVAWLTCFITGSGLYFSARFARTTSAVVASFALVVGLWVIGPILAGLMGVMGGKNDVLATYLWAHPAVQTQLIMTGAAGSQNAGASWGSLRYATAAVFHSGREEMSVGRVTCILTALAAAYILAGLFFFWRAKCCLRRRIF